jgi:hypothetical protein
VKSPPKICNTINSFSKVAGYKISLQNSASILCTNNEQIEKKYRKTIPFIIAFKKIKYLVINLTKDVNDLYKENYKPPKKEIEEDCRRWRDLPCSWIGNITKSNLHVLCKSHQNPNDIHHIYFSH